MTKISVTKQELEKIVQDNPEYKESVKGLYHAARELKSIRDEIKKGNISKKEYTRYSNEINEAIKNTSGYKEIKKAIIENRNSEKQQKLESSVSETEQKKNYPISFENTPTGVTWPVKRKKEQVSYSVPEKNNSNKENTTKEKQETYNNPFILKDPFEYTHENRKLREEGIKRDREEFQKKRKASLEEQRKPIQEKRTPVYEFNTQKSTTSESKKKNTTQNQTNRINNSGEIIELNALERQQEKRNKRYHQTEDVQRNPEKRKRKGLIKKLAGGIAASLAGIYVVSSLFLGSGCMPGDEKKEKVIKNLNPNPQVQQIDQEKENYGHARIKIERPSENDSEETYNNPIIARILQGKGIANQILDDYNSSKQGISPKDKEAGKRTNLEGVLENVEDVLWTNENEIEESDYFKKQWYGLRVEKNKKDNVIGMYLSQDFPNSENMYFLGQRKEGGIEVFREDHVYNINIKDYDAIGAGEIISNPEGEGNLVVYRTGVRTDKSGKISPIRTDDIKSITKLSPVKVPEKKTPSFFSDMQRFNEEYNGKGYTRVDGYQNPGEVSN